MQTDFSRLIFFLREVFIMKNSSVSHQNLLRFEVLVCTIILLTGCCTGPVAAAQDSNTSVLVFTDWHSATAQSSVMIKKVKEEAAAHNAVIVCFNGDSETDKKYDASIEVSVIAWERDHAHVTPFMNLVSDLLQIPNVQVVVGLGNHELAMNYKDKDTEKTNLIEALDDYILKFKDHAGANYNSRVYIVNTDLVWKSGGPMDRLYQDGTIRRSVDLHGITFLSVLGPILGEDIKFGKGPLYANQNPSYEDIMTTMRNQISNAEIKNSCVLLAHAAYYNYHYKKLTGIKDYLDSMSLKDPKQSTYLFTGHDHSYTYNTCRYDVKNVRAWMQPDPFGKGAAIVYAKPNGYWFGTSLQSKVVEF